MHSFSEAQIEASRKRLGVPEDWEWFSCDADCGDLVWCPPGVGDLAIRPVCSQACLETVLSREL